MAPKHPHAHPQPKSISKRDFAHGQGGAFDTHKDRSLWFFQRAAFPLRDAPPVELEKYWGHPENYARVVNAHWDEAGPANYAGRVTALVADAKNWDTFYAGSAGGGVWKTTNGGKLWTSCWPRLLNHNIGALAIHPVNSDELYCATGEGNLSADSYPGSGIFFTNDGGLTWTPYFVDVSGHVSEDVNLFVPRRVGTIAWGLARDNIFRIALGAVSHDETLPAALYLDSGGLAPSMFWGNRSYNCYAVAFHPTTPGVLYASIETRGVQNGIWRSDDFGKSWRQLRNGLPPGDICRRMSLAISQSNPKVLYTMACSRTTSVLGVFRSEDGGETWKEVGGQHFAHESQLSYNNVIAIHPQDPNFAVCGATELHLTKDGGQTWTQITTGQRGVAGQPFPPNYVHNDHHALIITATGAIYSGNDGGVAVTLDGGKIWEDRSTGMVTTMFYAADVAQSNCSIFGGGTQDQGSFIAGVPDTPGGQTPEPRNFTRVLGGDAGWMQFDPADEEHVFASNSDLLLSRHRRGEPWAHGNQLVIWTQVSISDQMITDAERKLRSIAVMEIEPVARPGIKKVWAGTYRLWETGDDGASWKPISDSFDDSAISAIECAAANPNIMYVGTTSGAIFRSTDGGKTWSGDMSSCILPRRLITRIAAHPADASTVVVTVASTGVPGTSLSNTPGSRVPYGHVFKSVNGGETWSPLDDNLPDAVYNAIAFQNSPPHALFVGGDCGVWVSADIDPTHVVSGGRWLSLAGNMPNVVVSDLIFHDKDRILTAATYGRGIWRLKLPEQFFMQQPDAKTDENVPFAAGLSRDDNFPGPDLVSPAAGAKLQNRSIHLSWTPVAGAIAYAIDVEQPQYTYSVSSVTTEVTFDYTPFGSGPPSSATWQVWAILPESRRSQASEKRPFTVMV